MISINQRGGANERDDDTLVISSGGKKKKLFTHPLHRIGFADLVPLGGRNSVSTCLSAADINKERSPGSPSTPSESQSDRTGQLPVKPVTLSSPPPPEVEGGTIVLT